MIRYRPARIVPGRNRALSAEDTRSVRPFQASVLPTLLVGVWLGRCATSRVALSVGVADTDSGSPQRGQKRLSSGVSALQEEHRIMPPPRRQPRGAALGSGTRPAFGPPTRPAVASAGRSGCNVCGRSSVSRRMPQVAVGGQGVNLQMAPGRAGLQEPDHSSTAAHLPCLLSPQHPQDWGRLRSWCPRWCPGDRIRQTPRRTGAPADSRSTSNPVVGCSNHPGRATPKPPSDGQKPRGTRASGGSILAETEGWERARQGRSWCTEWCTESNTVSRARESFPHPRDESSRLCCWFCTPRGLGCRLNSAIHAHNSPK